MHPHFRTIVWGLCTLGCRMLYAQPSPLPLEVGNYWAFDRVLGETRSFAGRLEVCDKVRVLPVSADTFWSDPQKAFGDRGDEYFRLAIARGVRLFHYAQPETLLVNMDQQGGIWSRGYILKNTIRVVVQEQPWLLAVGPWKWECRLDQEDFANVYAREQWIGQAVCVKDFETTRALHLV